jgi:hypothetical protein
MMPIAIINAVKQSGGKSRAYHSGAGGIYRATCAFDFKKFIPIY